MDVGLFGTLLDSLSYADERWLADLAWVFAATSGLALLVAFAFQTRRDLVRGDGRVLAADRWVPAAFALGIPAFSWSFLSSRSGRSYLGHDAELLEAFLLHSDEALLPLPALLGESQGTWGRLFYFWALLVDRAGDALTPFVPQPILPLLSDEGVYWPLALLVTGVLVSTSVYFMARSWGAAPWAAGVGVLLALASPPFIFHTGSFSGHLLGGLVLALGLHIQLRRLSEGKLLTSWALVEGWVVLAAAFYTRYTSVYLLLPLVAVRLLAQGSPSRRLAHVAGLSAGTLLLMAPELPRMRVLAAGQATSHIFSQYGAESVRVMSLRNLLNNLTFESASAYLDPLLGPGLLGLVVVGLVVMWRSTSGKEVDLGAFLRHGHGWSGRAVGFLVVLTLVGQVGISYLNTHPGSRSLLPLFFWAAVPLAHAVGLLASLPGGRWSYRRLLIAALLAAGAWQAALGQQDLQQNWVDGSSRAFDRASAGVPDLSHSELVPVLKRWAGGRSVNVICNARSNPFDVAVAPEEERDFIQGYYGLPIVTWSDKFRSFPTLYVTEQADFTWSLEFRRDYFIQINSTFELSPAFMFDGRLVFTVTPRGESVVPFPGWAI